MTCGFLNIYSVPNGDGTNRLVGGSIQKWSTWATQARSDMVEQVADRAYTYFVCEQDGKLEFDLIASTSKVKNGRNELGDIIPDTVSTTYYTTREVLNEYLARANPSFASLLGEDRRPEPVLLRSDVHSVQDEEHNGTPSDS